MYYLLAGFLTSGADLLRRTLTGDSEYQRTKKHSKNKRSKMALSHSERKVNLACIQFDFPFCHTHTHPVFCRISCTSFSLKKNGSLLLPLHCSRSRNINAMNRVMFISKCRLTRNVSVI